MSENVEIANAETIAWGTGPALPPPPEPTAKTWQAPAVIGVFLVLALVAAAVGIALGSGTSEEDLIVASENAPKTGVCRTYDSEAALAKTNDSPAVPCSGPHAAQTFAVEDTLPAPDSNGEWTDLQLQVAANVPCSDEKAVESIGLTTAEGAARRFTAVFFTPPPSEAKKGARWVRCDVLLTNKGQSSTVSGDFKTLADIPGAFVQCSGVSIGSGSRAPVRCTDSSTLSAVVGTVDFATLDDAEDVADVRARCRDIAVKASGLETPTWSATLPIEGGPGSGIALCWLQDDQWKVDRAAWPAEQSVGAASDSVSV